MSKVPGVWQDVQTHSPSADDRLLNEQPADLKLPETAPIGYCWLI